MFTAARFYVPGSLVLIAGYALWINSGNGKVAFAGAYDCLAVLNV